MMKKKAKLILTGLLAVMLVLGALAMTGCGKKETTYKVEFMDGETVLKTVQVKEGAYAEEYTPTKDGFTFMGWYATKTLTEAHRFKFDEIKITKDTRIYSSWKSATFTKDERNWAIAGTSSVGPLKQNNWGKVVDQTPYKLARTSDTENTFVLTIDLYVGDEFQIADILYDADKEGDARWTWKEKRGYGYFSAASENFEGVGTGFGEENSYGSNTKVKIEGKYKLTLKTEPSNAALDKIEYERVGDAANVEVVLQPALAGTITGGGLVSDWETSEFKFVHDEEADSWSLTVSLNKGDEFAVLPIYNSWTVQYQTKAVDADASDKVYNADGKGNIVMTETGKFTVTLSEIDITEKTGKVVIKKAGAFEAGENDNTVTVKYGEGADETTTLSIREGAKIPAQAAVIPAGKVFVGWYREAGETDTPFSFAGPLTDKKNEITIYAKFIAGTENDPREMFIRGGINGWGSTSYKDYKMTRTSAHLYTFDLTVANYKTEGEFTVEAYLGLNDDGTPKTQIGITFKGPNVDAEASMKTDLTFTNNINIGKNGTFTVTLDTLTQKITVVEKAA